MLVTRCSAGETAGHIIPALHRSTLDYYVVCSCFYPAETPFLAPMGGAKNNIQHLAYVDALGNSKLVTEMAKATTGAADSPSPPPPPACAKPSISISSAPLTEGISLRSRQQPERKSNRCIQSGVSSASTGMPKCDTRCIDRVTTTFGARWLQRDMFLNFEAHADTTLERGEGTPRLCQYVNDI